MKKKKNKKETTNYKLKKSQKARETHSKKSPQF